jgi:hypothetical protein
VAEQVSGLREILDKKARLSPGLFVHIAANRLVPVNKLLGHDKQESIVLGIDPAFAVHGGWRVSRANGQVLEDVP